ncbi:MAG: L-2-amino-thiazoline-4-carboxylic acid hydrolase [Chloroflexi bacterium]|nr:L-2-amino-thiazoline-4-carboxylic acid hydrolase [Chloroflexota bacterium]
MASRRHTYRESRLLRDFDRTVHRISHLLIIRYGAERAGAWIEEARREFAVIIPQLPDVGGKQPFTQFVTATGWFLALYRVLQRHGQTVEEAGRLCYDATAAYLRASPGFARRLLGYMTFSPRYLNRLKRRAAESQRRERPGDYVFTYVEGDGEGFDYGVDYQECASVKFLAAQGASELAPYLCAADKLYSDMLGWGLRRTMTLAEGYDKCDFRFKKGGPTRVRLPAALEQPDGQASPGG